MQWVCSSSCWESVAMWCFTDHGPSLPRIAVPARSHRLSMATSILRLFRMALATLPPLYGLAWEGMTDGCVISRDGLEVQGSPFPLPGAFSAAKRLLGMCWLCSLSQGQEHLGPKGMDVPAHLELPRI